MCHLLRMPGTYKCLRSLTSAGALLSGACRHGIDQVPARAVREAAADLRQARRDAERNAQWPPQTEASEDVVLSAPQSAAQARQHSEANGSLGAAASSFKAGPLDQVSLQPQVNIAVDGPAGQPCLAAVAQFMHVHWIWEGAVLAGAALQM